MSYFLGYFEELKFAKRTFKQNLRTRQISASFPCDSSVYHGNVKCVQKAPGEGGHFPLRLSHDSLRETKITPVDVGHVSARALLGQIFH